MNEQADLLDKIEFIRLNRWDVVKEKITRFGNYCDSNVLPFLYVYYKHQTKWIIDKQYKDLIFKIKHRTIKNKNEYMNTFYNHLNFLFKSLIEQKYYETGKAAIILKELGDLLISDYYESFIETILNCLKNEIDIIQVNLVDILTVFVKECHYWTFLDAFRKGNKYVKERMLEKIYSMPYTHCECNTEELIIILENILVEIEKHDFHNYLVSIINLWFFYMNEGEKQEILEYLKTKNVFITEKMLLEDDHRKVKRIIEELEERKNKK